MSGSENDSRRRFLAGAAALAPVMAVAGVAAVACAQTQAPRANGKVALVTGSSRGIGATTAKRLARDGFAVTVNCEKNRDLAIAVVDEIKSLGGRAIWVQADVSDGDAVRRLFDETERAFGGVDVVVSNAGVMRLALFHAMSDSDFARMLDVNQKGSFFVLREGARRVRDASRRTSRTSSLPCAATTAAGSTDRRSS